ncbi:MAG: carbohydrate-binding domain-containing protein [Clostridiales bacterium]|nr:carbohydrate-binding domain-containing protein [Clostridiales bacterium]
MRRSKLISCLTALAILFGILVFPGAALSETDILSLYKLKDVDASYNEADVVKVNLSTVKGDYSINRKGTYLLKGKLNGRVIISVPEEDKVRLVLDGVSVTAATGPAIYEKQSDKLIITLAPNSVNTLVSGTPISVGGDTIASALFCEDDLSINGSGSLNVVSPEKHGIQSKADLIIADGRINVESHSDGIRGKNSVLVLGGTISVTAQGDGIVSTKTGKDNKGWIIIADGNISVTTGSGAAGAKEASDEGSQQSTSASQKGIKAAVGLTILNGSISLDTADDGFHAVDVSISGGDISVSSGDDGVHADDAISVKGGKLTVIRSGDGLKAARVVISGGTVNVTSSDDGINATVKEEQAASSSTKIFISISGGEVIVNASGDGLDSEGNLVISGGVVGVWTLAEEGKGTLEFEGTGKLSGGTLLVATTQGGEAGIGTLSGQGIMAFPVPLQNSSQTISLTNSAGKELISFAPAGLFNTVILSSNALPEGSAFSLNCAGETIYSGTFSAN